MTTIKRIDDIELRWGLDSTLEIVEWINDARDSGGEHAMTLMIWTKSADGYDIKFQGMRPFRAAHTNDCRFLWQLMQYGQRIVDADFDFEHSIKS